jgi:hypothetical protein
MSIGNVAPVVSGAERLPVVLDALPTTPFPFCSGADLHILASFEGTKETSHDLGSIQLRLHQFDAKLEGVFVLEWGGGLAVGSSRCHGLGLCVCGGGKISVLSMVLVRWFRSTMRRPS